MIAIAVAGIDHYCNIPVAGPAHGLRYGYGPRDFAGAHRLANDQIALGEERTARAPEQWAYQESYARALMGRARLTGSFDDLARARAALDRSMADAPDPAGPLLTDAVNYLTIHRLGAIPVDLKLLAASAIPADPGDRAEAVAIAGDVAFYSGRYRTALADYAAAQRIEDGPGIAVRLANWHRKMGRSDDALRLIDRAIALQRSPTRLFHANMLLQRGVVELGRGNWDIAQGWFNRADAVFAGYWMIQAHAAQMAAVAGDLAGAERQYLAILAGADTPLPEVMDALAVLYRVRGDAPDSRIWSERASTIWKQRVAQLPEAAYGHALEHELLFGGPAVALDLARRNFAARPYGDSITMLAWALLVNRRAPEAVQAIEALNRTGWRTAGQYVVLSEALALAGRPADSERARAGALALNPRAFDPAGALIWFGNH